MTDEEKIARRIACPEVGYPLSEAKYATEEEYWNEEGDCEDCWCGATPPTEEEFRKMWNEAVSKGDKRSFEEFCMDWF